MRLAEGEGPPSLPTLVRSQRGKIGRESFEFCAQDGPSPPFVVVQCGVWITIHRGRLSREVSVRLTAWALASLRLIIRRKGSRAVLTLKTILQHRFFVPRSFQTNGVGCFMLSTWAARRFECRRRWFVIMHVQRGAGQRCAEQRGLIMWRRFHSIEKSLLASPQNPLLKVS